MDETLKCPACQGEGHIDVRDDDAVWAEHAPPKMLARMKARRGDTWMKVIRCSVCDGTGNVTREQFERMRSAAIGFVDMIRARAEQEDER